MLCKDPYMFNGMACPCTRCMPCRFNRRRLWSNRMLLESMKHGDSSFLTLTYDDAHLPSGGTLVPRDVQLFLKRLRKAMSPRSLRYFFVGEYGDSSERPHYHAAMYGLSLLDHALVRDAWGKGHIMLGDLTLHSAQYIAGYVVKKMTAKDDKRLNGRHPEFARMSLRPGIGAIAIDDVFKALCNQYGVAQLILEGDVPRSLKVAGKSLPLGRYLRRKLREKVGIYDPQTGEIGKAPQEVLQAYKAELQAMYENSQFYSPDLSQKEVLILENRQKVRNLENRTKIYQSKRSL